MEISATTLAGYLKTNTNLFSGTAPLQVSSLTREADSYVDGYLNYLFRVSQADQHYIVKHSKEEGASALEIGKLDPDRNYLEYMTYQLRRGFTEHMLPQVFFADQQEHLFVMEDLSQLQVMRFALSHGCQFPLLGQWVGEFLGKNHAYTSRFFLNAEQFNHLDYYFENDKMRKIVTDFILQPPLNNWDLPDAYAQSLLDILERIVGNRQIRNDWQVLLNNFHEKRECLIHGDFHTSNLFISAKGIKVIDMEYSMLAPFAYDLGYFLANLVSQYAAFHFHQKNPQQMSAYLLQMIGAVFDSYFDTFSKALPRQQDFSQLFVDILQDAIGYLALANICRTSNPGSFPDFDCLQKREEWFMAKGLSLKICEDLLLQRKTITSTQQLKQQITHSTDYYLKNLLTYA